MLALACHADADTDADEEDKAKEGTNHDEHDRPGREFDCTIECDMDTDATETRMRTRTGHKNRQGQRVGRIMNSVRVHALRMITNNTVQNTHITKANTCIAFRGNELRV